VLNGEVPNVMMWGAKGDGNTSGTDTVAIKNAIAGMTYVGKHLLFPSGTCVCEQHASYPSDAVSIKAETWDGKKHKAHNW
jgi:hypothetical protein